MKKVGFIIAAIIMASGYFINQYQQQPLPPVCTGVSSEYLLADKIDGKMVLLNEIEEVFMTTSYDDLDFLGNELYRAEYKGEFGLINTQCEVILDVEFKSIYLVDFNSMYMIIAQDKEGYTFRDLDGELIYDDTFDSVSANLIGTAKTVVANTELELESDNVFYNYIVEIDGMFGLVSIKGNKVIPIVYERIEVYNLEENIIQVKKDGKWGLINQFNEIVLPLEYELIDRHIIKDINEKYGFINSVGEIAVNSIYDYAEKVYNSQFQEDWYYVELDNKYGILNSDFDIEIPINYDSVYMDNDHIIVGEAGKYGIIDYYGETVIESIYDGMMFQIVRNAAEIKDFVKVRENELYGIINLDGDIVLPIEYDDFKVYENVIVVEKNGYFGVIDYEFNTIIGISYTDIQYISDTEYLVEEFNNYKRIYVE